MSSFEVTKCRSCFAPVIWARGESGSKMILDARPNAEGQFALIEVADPKGLPHPPVAIFAANHDPGRKLKLALYTSHFATCPDAKRWRKKK